MRNLRSLHAERAARLLRYYFNLATPGLANAPDSRDELVEIVDAIVAAAVEEMRAELKAARRAERCAP